MNIAKSRFLALPLLLGAAVITLLIVSMGNAPLAQDDNTDADCDTPVDVRGLEAVWTTDFCTYQPGVFDEILSGGVRRDGIPPIDDPTFVSIAEASETWQAQTPVIALAIDGEARAYPLGILTRHEIVNDQFGDRPVAVTFCPLCNSAIVFDRTVDGQTLRFGVSGLLRNSDLIMWDDVTESWWQQFTGEGIVGEYTGTLLDIIPSTVVSYEAFTTQYPDGTVLATNGRNYNNNPYTRYDSNANPFLFQGETDQRLFAVERVLGAFEEGEAVAYPFEVLAQEQVINDVLAGQDVVALWQPGAVSALDRGSIAESRDVGMAALYSRVVDDETLDFALDDDGSIIDTRTGTTWNIFGTAQTGELAGTQLEQIRAFPHFWFAWAAFRPDTRIYGVDSADSAE